ncbi:MAG: hypothetical protein M1838_004835 [Thelocarpon superellum]|nr:MAG: hypothetical protein M1838_004835 [Thelocarpon superellum]
MPSPRSITPHDTSPRNSPSPTSMASNTGSGYVWMLDHVLTYPATYEIPLRTMYTLNSSPRAQPLPPSHSRAGSADSPKSRSPQSRRPSSPEEAESPTASANDAAQFAAAQFKSNLMAQIAHLPSQPCSLPPSFILSFVRRCFPEDLTRVDFPQALTGLDYLRDLESRRLRELNAALRRVGIDRCSLGEDGEEKTSGNAAISAWVKAVDDKERRVEALYTQVYLNLRKWTLINEMSLLPFNKSNCLAMLNTLYPPATTSQPTRTLTPEVLSRQRSTFWRYIQAVGINGPSVLENVIHQGRRLERGDTTGWPMVRETLDQYLRAANAVIDECVAITGPDSFLGGDATEDQRRNGRKVDSGVSFQSDDRPSTSSSVQSKEKPLPPPPAAPRSGTTLEKIARELRKFRDRKRSADHGRAGWSAPAEPLERGQPKPLRRMKSAGALGELREKNKSFGGGTERWQSPSTPVFGMDEEARRKAIREATNAASQQTPPRPKHKPLMDFGV